MHMAGIPIAALIAIVVFGVLCALLGVACLFAALRQRALNADIVVIAAPRETLSRETLARETLTDGFGVIIYRAFNRILISTLGGGILIALLRAKSRA